MENRVGEHSNREGKKKNKDFSDATKNTISKIKRNRYHRHDRDKPTLCRIHDHSSPGYGWLLPGWVAEERHMVSGKIYRYYYDPEGRQYKNRNEVIEIWEKSESISPNEVTTTWENAEMVVIHKKIVGLFCH
ncbi:hypothetical protein VNO77_11468 [Canavalia gladiata]|uniref:MBD domain-containing protein n=1 Tax=Canavalia gladiata TaxID=3824 RepID=A0AAN9MBJ4_CANGL